MAVTPVDKEYLVLHFNEFNTDEFTETRISALNDTAALFLAESVLGDMTRYARMLFIAHVLKISINEGNGPVVSRKVGDLAESYANQFSGGAAGFMGGLNQTGYGQALKELIIVFGKSGTIFYGV